MTDTNQTLDSSSTSTPKRRRRHRRWLMFGLPIVAIAGLVSARAFAHGRRHGWGGGQDLTEDELKDRRQHMVEFAARYLEATAQQKTRLQALADEVAPQLQAMRKEGKSLRDKAHEAVRSDDRAQLEQLRKEAMLLGERASQQWLTAYGKLADILTAEQREQLAEHLGERGRGLWH